MFPIHAHRDTLCSPKTHVLTRPYERFIMQNHETILTTPVPCKRKSEYQVENKKETCKQIHNPRSFKAFRCSFSSICDTPFPSIPCSKLHHHKHQIPYVLSNSSNTPSLRNSSHDPHPKELNIDRFISGSSLAQSTSRRGDRSIDRSIIISLA